VNFMDGDLLESLVRCKFHWEMYISCLNYEKKKRKIKEIKLLCITSNVIQIDK
jgi:hypothetical protein